MQDLSINSRGTGVFGVPAPGPGFELLCTDISRSPSRIDGAQAGVPETRGTLIWGALK